MLIIQNMSLVDQFVEQQLSKTLSSSITQQLQICHSAVQQLMINLESLRTSPKIQIINSKLSRFSIFLEAKQQILKLIQSQAQQPLIQWLIQYSLSSELLIELVKRESEHVEQNLKRTLKQVFLGGQKIEEYIQQNQMVENCLTILNSIKEDLMIGKTPGRQKLVNIDRFQRIVWERIYNFDSKIHLFNQEIAKLVMQLYDFEAVMYQQFRGFLSKNKNLSSQITKSKIDKPSDEIFEENIILESINKRHDIQFSKTGGSRFGIEVKQDNLFKSSFPKRQSFGNKSNQRNEISQLGLNSQLIINQDRRESLLRNTKSQLSETKPFLR